MPISEELLERIERNDPTLIELNLAKGVDSSLGPLTKSDRDLLTAALSCNKTLRYIDLNDNEFSIIGILEAQKDNKNLRILKLRNNLLARGEETYSQFQRLNQF
jgi:hypothetical protein